MKCEFSHDYTTQRRHMQRSHAKAYRHWCKESGFVSMLPDDTKKRREAEEGGTQQATLDAQWEGKEKIIPYSSEAFRAAAREWMIETDQPLSAMDHRQFRKMIHIASRATNGVRIPGRKQVRQEIMDAFRRQMREMKERLSVSVVR
ncbi:hypothetical protein SISNIDRAFT_418577 [Sistotremastrum niveocremeum HHB9708]|uniref:Uncharacterized protein n=1 Tax=Sistotremastrum niveocremeum HHB9708 TaxID=1314777 RepID=A0A164P029_9AGAM|nr:hypothetical protein SISNIDRAFT_418577 [Sistotremastrum niveocremeum HHB9708]